MWGCELPVIFCHGGAPRSRRHIEEVKGEQGGGDCWERCQSLVDQRQRVVAQRQSERFVVCCECCDDCWMQVAWEEGDQGIEVACIAGGNRKDAMLKLMHQISKACRHSFDTLMPNGWNRIRMLVEASGCKRDHCATCLSSRAFAT